MLDRSSEQPIKIAGKGRKRAVLRLSAALFDGAAIITAFAVACIIRLGMIDMVQLYNLLIVTLPIYFGIAINNRAYGVSALHKVGTSFQRAATSLIFAVGCVVLVAFFLKASESFSRLIFGMGVLGSFLMLGLGRYVIRQVSWKMLGRSPMAELVICDGIRMVQDVDGVCLDAKAYGIHPSSKNPLDIQKLGMAVQDMDRVIVHCKAEFRDDWSHALKALDVNGEIVVPELTNLAPISLNKRDGHISLAVSLEPLKWQQRLSKRVFDIAVSSMALIILALPMIVIAIVIKIDSAGPVLFKQQRIGLGNRPFSILKFRSMKQEASDATGSVSTRRGDDRITALGSFLRQSSIDELPQFINVLRGDMSVVGPRPHAMESTAEDQLFWDIDNRYFHRHTIKPGVTGLAQIRGFRGATEKTEDLESRLQSDLEYRANWSLWGDIKIMMKTFRVLIHKNAF